MGVPHPNAFKNARTLFMRFPGGRVVPRRGVAVGVGIHHGRALSPSTAGPTFLARRGQDLAPAIPRTRPTSACPCPLRWRSGDTVQFDVAFTTQLPSLLFRMGHYEGFHLVAQWFPKLARLEPDGRWAHFAFHHLSEFYADFGSYDVTVDTPGDMVVGATGRGAGEVRLPGVGGDRIARRFVQENVHDFAFAAWNRFEELTALSEDGVALRVLYPPGYERAAAVELDSVRFGLSHLGKAFGRYPYETLTMVHPPAGADEAGGMEYPTLITTGGPWYFPWTGARFVDVVTIHELGHQWFYGLVATDEHTFPFLDEGINSYAEIDAMEALFPGTSAFHGLGIQLGIAALDRAGAADAERNAPVAQAASDFVTGRDYGALVYQRTATILATLGNVYGEDLVRRAVGRYARRYRFQHPGPAELESTVREVVGDDAATQLHAALFDRATVDYLVDDLESPAEAGADGGYGGSVLVRRRGALRFPVDVEMVGADGTVQRVRWDAAETAERLPYHGQSKLVAAVVDPDHEVLLDDDLSNNARRTVPSRVSGALIDRIAFAAEALLSGILP